MAQPKTPPISIRPSAALLAEVDEWAKTRKLTRHAAILALIDFGLGAPQPRTIAVQVSREKREPRVVEVIVEKSEPKTPSKLALSLPSGAKLKDPNA